MPVDTLERPRFVEGQYIGADDLDAIVAYHRARQAEHQLAGHSWGIQSGLELVERPDPAGGIETLLQPGYATDGYGRALIVRSAMPLGLDPLRGRPSGSYRVWINHRETPEDAIRPGYGVCPCDGEAFSRIAEGWEILITGELRLDEREAGVHCAGALRPDARLVRRLLEPEGPFLCDASVPEQAPHPRGGRARWLVPLGLVQWDDAQGRLVPLDASGRKGSRIARRYAGVVAECIHAAGGLIRLRPRLAQPPPGTPDSEVDNVCAGSRLRDGDLDAASGQPVFHELVWVEGHLRLTGDQRIWGGRIDLRDAQGGDGGRPLHLRADANTLAPQPGRDLQVALGTQADGSNRLLVGPAGPDGKVAGSFAVTSAGRVGIGTTVPAAGLALDVRGAIGIPAGDARLRLLGSEIRDDGQGRLLLTSGGTTIAMPDAADSVVIGAADPAPGLKLDVRGAIGIPAGDARLRLLGSEIRDDGQGRLLLRSGGAVIAAPDPADRVVIGAADPAPGLKLDVRGDLGRVDGPATLHLWGSTLGDLGDGVLRIRSGGATVAFDGVDRVGIGTTTPATKLHVNGAATVAGALLVGGAAQFDGVVNVDNVLFADTFAFGSDLRLKKNIEPLTGALAKLLELRGTFFEWQDPEKSKAGRSIGLIADEVERVMPGWVVTAPNGFKALAPHGIEALLIEAVRELADRCAALEQRLATLAPAKGRPTPGKPSPRSTRRAI